MRKLAIFASCVLSAAAFAQEPAATAPSCGAPATFIHEVQGASGHSPLVGERVTIEGVVVGDFQRDGDEFGTNLGGVMLQEEDADADEDPFTSEGVYVFTQDWPVDLQLGDLVRVSGVVSEYYDLTELTELTDLTVCASGLELPSPAVIEFPVAAVSDLEAFEGMLVTFPQDLVISEFFDYDRFGEVVLAFPPAGLDRFQQPTALFGADDERVPAYLDLMQRSRIILDDGIGDQNPAVVRHPDGGLFTADHGFRGGDILRNLTGVLDYSFDEYRVQPVLGAEFLQANPRTLPPVVGGSVRAGSLNVLNYFVTLGSRGADDEGEFDRQRTKILEALNQMDLHVAGLVEIQNDADQASLIDLVAGLNGLAGEGTYDYIRTGGPLGTDEITVALIYQPAVLEPVGGPAVLTDPMFIDPFRVGAERNRPTLTQAFRDLSSGTVFTVSVNHFKSKGSECGEPNEGGLTGNCGLTRNWAATTMLNWLATDPTGTGPVGNLLVGDYNSYDHEGPVLLLRAGPDGRANTADDYTDLLREFTGENAYTYVFDGQLGYLDYALASAGLFEHVTGAAAWHINADEADIIDYDTTFKSREQALLYRPDAFRSSDHDPILIGLDFGAAQD